LYISFLITSTSGLLCRIPFCTKPRAVTMSLL
jgi:hypothetical protein